MSENISDFLNYPEPDPGFNSLLFPQRKPNSVVLYYLVNLVGDLNGFVGQTLKYFLYTITLLK